MKTGTGNDNDHSDGITRQDVYTRVTDHIGADLEQGVRTWAKPWSRTRGGKDHPPVAAQRRALFRHGYPHALRCVYGRSGECSVVAW